MSLWTLGRSAAVPNSDTSSSRTPFSQVTTTAVVVQQRTTVISSVVTRTAQAVTSILIQTQTATEAIPTNHQATITPDATLSLMLANNTTQTLMTIAAASGGGSTAGVVSGSTSPSVLTSHTWSTSTSISISGVAAGVAPLTVATGSPNVLQPTFGTKEVTVRTVRAF